MFSSAVISGSFLIFLASVESTLLVENYAGTSSPEPVCLDYGVVAPATEQDLKSVNAMDFGQVTKNGYYASFWCYTIMRHDRATNLLSVMAGIPNTGYDSGDGGPVTSATFDHIWSIKVDPTEDYLYLTTYRHIRRINLSTMIVEAFAGDGSDPLTCGTCGDNGAATAATVSGAPGMAFNSSRYLFIGDLESKIRVIDTVARTIHPFADDLYRPDGLYIDTIADVMYVLENPICRITKIDMESGTKVTFMGENGCAISGNDGPVTAAQFIDGYFCGMDSEANLYLSQRYIDCQIRKIDASGIISVYAGISGCSGERDGYDIPATSAAFNSYQGACAISEDIVYIVDSIDGEHVLAIGENISPTHSPTPLPSQVPTIAPTEVPTSAPSCYWVEDGDSCIGSLYEVTITTTSYSDGKSSTSVARTYRRPE